ncbi:hypothetical protein C1Y41_04215 [Pantoea sp. ICBG 1758]|uniref:hypothetical protein n=1 Tax=Pantoea sp. ICBG 1758 TaxID=2071682 RepID=UPI000CE573B6|nr:hypothetical protein [Pantoea sp. ICBG 1758]PPC63856.1 hypothetical protein C1Y41_04215 [Pantoea sp. ICBG 1758]
MKLKIKGTITPERIAKAFKTVLEEMPYYKDHVEEFRIRQATIYFNFYHKPTRRCVNFIDKNTDKVFGDYQEIIFEDPKPPKKPKKPKLKLLKGGKK